MRNHILRFYIHLGPSRFPHPFGLELVDMSTWLNFWIRLPMTYFQFFLSRHSLLIRLELMRRTLLHKVFWRTGRYKKYKGGEQ